MPATVIAAFIVGTGSTIVLTVTREAAAANSTVYLPSEPQVLHKAVHSVQ